MSAVGITESVISAIESSAFDLIVVNFANCDMVGHTGVLEAGVKAVECVDSCLDKILSALDAKDGNALIIADHGNAEKMLNEDNSPNTAHTIFPVPVILFGSDKKINKDGSLKDVAPTILELLDLSIPKEMTGKSLLSWIV